MDIWRLQIPDKDELYAAAHEHIKIGAKLEYIRYTCKYTSNWVYKITVRLDTLIPDIAICKCGFRPNARLRIDGEWQT